MAEMNTFSLEDVIRDADDVFFKLKALHDGNVLFQPELQSPLEKLDSMRTKIRSEILRSTVPTNSLTFCITDAETLPTELSQIEQKILEACQKSGKMKKGLTPTRFELAAMANIMKGAVWENNFEYLISRKKMMMMLHQCVSRKGSPINVVEISANTGFKPGPLALTDASFPTGLSRWVFERDTDQQTYQLSEEETIDKTLRERTSVDDEFAARLNAYWIKLGFSHTEHPADLIDPDSWNVLVNFYKACTDGKEKVSRKEIDPVDALDPSWIEIVWGKCLPEYKVEWSRENEFILISKSSH